MTLAIHSGIAVREWCPELANDPRVLDTAFAVMTDAAQAAKAARRG